MTTKKTEGKSSNPLEELVAKVESSFGKGSIFAKGHSKLPEPSRTPTNILSLDKKIGGGFPKGTIVEVYGLPSSGKTTVSLLTAAEVQKQGGKVMFVDAEMSLNTHWASILGVDVDSLIMVQPDSAEQAFSIAEMAIDTGAVDLIIIDSIAALVPEKELEGEVGDSNMGVMARLMSQVCRKLTAKLAKSKTTLITLNQVRMKIGGYGNPEVTTGGNALPFYSSIRLRVAKGLVSKNSDGEHIGNIVSVTSVKNKTFPPYKKAEIYLDYETGYDYEQDLLNIAVEKGIVKKGGSWYSYGETKLGQGAQNVADLLRDNIELAEELKAQING